MANVSGDSASIAEAAGSGPGGLPATVVPESLTEFQMFMQLMHAQNAQLQQQQKASMEQIAVLMKAISDQKAEKGNLANVKLDERSSRTCMKYPDQRKDWRGGEATIHVGTPRMRYVIR